MTEREIKKLDEKLNPYPRSVKYSGTSIYSLVDGCSVKINLAEDCQILEKVNSIFEQYWDITANISIDKSATKYSSIDEYKIEINETLLTISAQNMVGVLNAFKTLRQLSEVNRHTKEISGYFLVSCVIEDRPSLSFRGIHYCIFPETELWFIEKNIRIAAYYKFNYAVIECWGNFPFQSHSEVSFSEHKIDRTELKRLIILGKELGITLVPQFNILGHATGARVMSGKHSTLDFNKKLEPLFEPAGWTWCLSNPETIKLLEDLVVELHEFFDNPPFFHIGCDESYDLASCMECRKKDIKELVKGHILHFYNLLKKRNSRTIMWHDMLLDMADKRWESYVAGGNANLSELYKELPKDIIIADWQYCLGTTKERIESLTWPTTKFFKTAGFDVVVSPWWEMPVTLSFGEEAEREKLFGMLETTWNDLHCRFAASIYTAAPVACWNSSRKIYFPTVVFNYHLRQISQDMGISEYRKSGTVQKQVTLEPY